jgi:hypothetical protein
MEQFVGVSIAVIYQLMLKFTINIGAFSLNSPNNCSTPRQQRIALQYKAQLRAAIYHLVLQYTLISNVLA